MHSILWLCFLSVPQARATSGWRIGTLEILHGILPSTARNDGKQCWTSRTGAQPSRRRCSGRWVCVLHVSELKFMLAACSMLFVKRRNAALQQANGSILLATDAAGVDALETRAAALHAQGIPSELLSAQQTMRAEPAVALPTCGGGLLVPSDAQLVS